MHQEEISQIKEIATMKNDIKYIKDYIVKKEESDEKIEKTMDTILDEIRGLKRNTDGLSKRVIKLEVREKKTNEKITEMYKVYEITGWFLTTNTGKFVLSLILVGLSSLYFGKEPIQDFLKNILSNF